MAKSHLKKGANINVDMIKNLADVASKYVVTWTKSEAERLFSKELVIIETDQGYRVGRYHIKNLGASWAVYDQWEACVGYFTCKRSAVTWSLLFQTGKLTASRTLLKEDNLVNKLIQDTTYYNFRKQRAIKRGDYFKADLCEARLTGITGLLSRAKDDLEKTLNSTKYLKGIWEKPL